MDEINSIAKKYNLTVIEDAAQSFGATYKAKKSFHSWDRYFWNGLTTRVLEWGGKTC